MWSDRLLPIALILLLVHDVAAERHQGNLTERVTNLEGEDEHSFDHGQELMDNHIDESGEEEDGYSGRSEDKMSPSERAEKILTMEGQPGWLELVKKQAKETMEKMKEKMEEKDGAQNKYSLMHGSMKEQHDSSPPTALISDVVSKLSGFKGPLATRVKAGITGLETKWASLAVNTRPAITKSLRVVASNLEKFGNAGSNPIKAVQGAINIVAAIAPAFGPIGQAVSSGLNFISALLGLFGKGPKPKSMATIVSEQINSAIEKFRDETLTAKAGGVITAFQQSKTYLDGLALSGKSLSEQETIALSSNVPVTQGLAFMGELAWVIKKLKKKNTYSAPNDAKKCIKYTELYVQLAALKDLMLTQMISLSSSSMTNSINGIIAIRQTLREGTKVSLQPFYTIDFGNNILPYFDPDISVITDSYATAMFNLGQYDRSMAGYYCLEYENSQEFVWSTDIPQLKLKGGAPYTTLRNRLRNNKHCYWKLVPHGKSIFSIVNKKGCDRNDARCGWMLSWDKYGSEGYVNINEGDPVLWEINGAKKWKSIRSKWGCDTKSKWCNRELRVLKVKYAEPQPWYWQVLPIMNIVSAAKQLQKKEAPLGIIVPSDGIQYWRLRRRSQYD